VDFINGDLVEEKADRARVIATVEEIKWFYCECLWIAEYNGYDRKWAYFKTKEKYSGFKAPWDWQYLEPIVVSPSTARWIRSRNIAWAKGRGRAA
jgi:hypothetical protein